MPVIATNTWFRTWQDRPYEKVDINRVLIESKLEDESTPSSSCSSPTAVPLSSALSQMSLAYSPVTKQLHKIEDNENLKVEFVIGDENTNSSPEEETKLSLSDNKSIASADLTEQSSFIGEDTEPKKGGLSNLFAKLKTSSNNKTGWKFFTKVFSSSDSRTISKHSSDTSLKALGEQKYGSVVASSSALILNSRPANLPAKSSDEHDKHRLEYEEIIEAARKKEVQVSLQKQRALEQQLKQEEQQANAVRVWTVEVLPNWAHARSQRKTQELWWCGIPPCVRGKVWRLAITNELNITPELFDICVARAQERLNSTTTNGTNNCCNCDSDSGMELIKLDIARTFPHLCIFQKGGPYYDILHKVLSAYACYRPDVGYVQGMSFVAAILILNLDAVDAFICFANLLNRHCLMAFFTLSQPLMQAYYDTYEVLLKENLPKLHAHLIDINLTPDLYLMEWVVTVFVKAMSLDISCRVWDVFVRDGEQFIFRTALGILNCYETELLKLDFIRGAQFLSKLPESLSSDLLFKSISSIKMQVNRNKFNEIFETHIDQPATIHR